LRIAQRRHLHGSTGWKHTWHAFGKSENGTPSARERGMEGPEYDVTGVTLSARENWMEDYQ